MSEPSIQTGGWELGIAPRASLALTIAATALLHVYVESRPADSQAHGWRVPAWPGQHTDHVDHALPPIGPGRPAIIEVTRRIPGELETRQFDTYHIATTPYARNFDNDPAVEVVNEEAVDALEDVATRLKADGWSNITFKIQGMASAEDATRDGIAGVQTPSDDNIRTANARRDALYRYLQTNAELPDVNIELLPGVEGELNDSQVHRLRSYAEQFGYEPRGDMSGTEVMIDDWELNPQSVPPEVDEELQLLLGDKNRGDLVTVFATRQVPGQETTKTEPELVCMVPVQRTETRYLVTNWSKGTIPWVIPIIVPYPRRRERDDYPDENFFGYSRSAAGAGGGTGSAEVMPLPRRPVTERPPKSPRVPHERRKWPLALIPLILVGGLALRYCDFDDPRPIPPPTNDACAADLRVVEKPTDKTKIITILDGRRVSTEYR